MDIRTEIAGIILDHPVMNAAGTCKTLESVRKLAQSASAAVVLGSITTEQRTRNDGKVFWEDPFRHYTLNSLGLPNQGAVQYAKELGHMARAVHEAGKPFFVSVAGFSPGEYVYLADLVLGCGADLVELNLGCPNVWHDGVQERIACFDPELVAEILKGVAWKVKTSARVSVKLSPFSDPFLLAKVAKVIGDSDVVKAVTTSNTFPNALGYNRFKRSIEYGNGLAGLGGSALKPIALGQVQQLRALLPKRINVIGVGGVQTGQDVWEYLQSGAAAVQIGTGYIRKNEGIFGLPLQELENAMQEQVYAQ